ncbi:hypothetical protein DPMN_065148 [Dreissena polymorpha]|uniref:Uncharacterized protein n=1 Tax=Dreissena polymorpha TaxID=45954 RepID=A0A9D4HLS5_DREPO|nr:hypothetical protein DPMN_065148 [Dreissena polymorpha]
MSMRIRSRKNWRTVPEEIPKFKSSVHKKGRRNEAPNNRRWRCSSINIVGGGACLHDARPPCCSGPNRGCRLRRCCITDKDLGTGNREQSGTERTNDRGHTTGEQKRFGKRR